MLHTFIIHSFHVFFLALRVSYAYGLGQSYDCNR